MQRPFEVVIMLLSMGFCGCTSFHEYVKNGFKVGPNYRPAGAAVSEAWIDSGDARIALGSADYSTWWSVFNDPVLNGLIETAYEQNLTLREAGLRVSEVQAQRKIAVGNLFPQSQQGFGEYNRSLRSLQQGGISAAIPASAFPRITDSWRFGSQLAWELDFWGRFRRSIEAADAQLDASVENYDDALVILFAEVATAYVDIRTAEQRLAYARQNVSLQEESSRVADARLRANEKDSELDAPQARSNLAQTESAIEGLEISLRQSKNRLSVLMGMPPHDLSELLGPPSRIPVAPDTVVVGVPAELLQRRPDVRRAEREAAAQSAEIGIAVSDLYPQISINGSLSLEASEFERLFDSRAWAGSIGPQFRWNILNYGRLRNNIAVQDARFQQLVTRFQQTVLKANEEAENAMVAFLHYHNQVQLLEVGEREAREAVRVATTKYDSGAVDYNRLFTVQQFLVSQQDQLATAQGNLAASLIQLYRALGGGWERNHAGTAEVGTVRYSSIGDAAEEFPVVVPVEVPEAAE